MADIAKEPTASLLDEFKADVWKNQVSPRSGETGFGAGTRASESAAKRSHMNIPMLFQFRQRRLIVGLSCQSRDADGRSHRAADEKPFSAEELGFTGRR
jgi:hypothetical protein